MRNNLFKQVNSLIDKKTEKVSSPVMPSLGNNQNVLGTPIIVDSGSTAKIEQLNNDINLIKTNMVGIPERILSGMEVKAVGGSVVSINSGSVYTRKGVFELSEQSSYRIDVSKQETQYIVIDNGILKTSNEISDDVLLIAKIVINVIGDEIDDNANADYSNNYIVSGRDLAINPQFEIDDDTRLVMSNILQEILASNLVGTIRLNEGLDITNQQDSVRLTSTGMGIYNDDVKFAEFIRDGIYFYNESGLMLSQYTKDGATIGNINILPDSIESTNFKSGNRGFQINSNGNVEFNNITARGTIVARDGLIGGVTIANQGLYVGINQFSSSFTPFYLDKQGRFSLGDKLTWDGTTLNIVGGLSVDWIDVTDSTGKKPSDNADVTTTAIGAGVVTTGRIELQNNSSVTGAGIRGGGTAGTEIRLWAGSTLASAASAPFRVTHDGALVASNATIKGAITATSGSFTGSITSTSGTIAGWDIQSTVLRSVVSASASRIELDKGNNRISIFDATNEKVVMGYLNGLPKNDGSGNYGAGDYGLLIRTGNKLSIDGGGEYFSGEYFIRNDASYLIKDAADKTIIRLGTDTGEKGLFIYNTAGTQLAKLISDKIFIGESTKYLQYTTAGGLDVKGNITADSGTFNGTVNANAGNFTSTVTIGSGATSGTLAVGTDTNKITIVGTNSQTTTKMYSGTGTYGNTNTGFYADASGRFSLKDKLTWDGTTLTVTGNVTANSLTANTAGSIAGWTLTAGKLASGNVGMQPATYPFYAGNATAASAPFRVDTSGNLTATTVSLSGGLTIGNSASIQTANKTSYSDTDAGIWLGVDGSVPKVNIGNDTDYVKWTGTNLEIKGNITADNIDEDYYYIPNTYVSNLNSYFAANFTAFAGGYLIRNSSKFFFDAGEFTLTADLILYNYSTTGYHTIELTGKSVTETSILCNGYTLNFTDFYETSFVDLLVNVGIKQLYTIADIFKMTDCIVKSSPQASRSGTSLQGVICLFGDISAAKITGCTFEIDYNRIGIYFYSTTRNVDISFNTFQLTHEGAYTPEEKVESIFDFNFTFDNVSITNNRFTDKFVYGSYNPLDASYFIYNRGTRWYYNNISISDNIFYQIRFYDNAVTGSGLIYGSDALHPDLQANSYVITYNVFHSCTFKYFLYESSIYKSIISNNHMITNNTPTFCNTFIYSPDTTEGLINVNINNNILNIASTFINAARVENGIISNNIIIPLPSSTVTITNSVGNVFFRDNVGIDLTGV